MRRRVLRGRPLNRLNQLKCTSTYTTHRPADFVARLTASVFSGGVSMPTVFTTAQLAASAVAGDPRKKES